jgi:hypothetical protein
MDPHVNPHFLRAVVLGALLLAWPKHALRAEDWTTTEGKTYRDVKVIEAASDAVTILHHDGGALISLSNLPADLQKRFNYDPARAEAAADARAKSDAESARALQAEMEQAAQQRKTEDQGQAAPTPATTQETEKDPAVPADSSHHSIAEVVGSSHSLQRDLTDPSYHTMEHFFYTSHTLAADSTDHNHHSISEITESGL